jgi:hypothetical protein
LQIAFVLKRPDLNEATHQFQTRFSITSLKEAIGEQRRPGDAVPTRLTRAVRQIQLMIDAERFDLIRRKHGAYGSWAVWAPPSSTSKSNVGDLWVLDERANPMLLETLNPGVVTVGLNFSRGSPYEPFQNFHDPRPEAHDFEIRFAFSGTPFWGAYMTDIIKSVVEPDSKALLKWLRRNPEVIMDHINAFRQELSDLGHPRVASRYL